MSLPVAAIIVSCLSALFTASNMAISYMTYRRVRPLVDIEILSISRKYGDGDRYEGLGVGVRLVNRSPSSATVERLVLKGRIKAAERQRLRRLRTMGIHRLKHDLILEPMAGVTHDLKFNVCELRLGHSSVRQVSVYAELTTGRTVRSPRMPRFLLKNLNELREQNALADAQEQNAALNESKSEPDTAA